jgi:hypothetical protein
VGNCIGERNHRFFFVFLVSISAMTVLTTVCAICVVVEAYRTVPTEMSEDAVGGDDGSGNKNPELSSLQRLWKAILLEKFTFLFGSFTLLCAWSLTSLLCFHAMIISVAQTTNERVRGVYRFGQVENDADHGCCWNWYTAACTPCPVSRLPRDMSQQVICDYCEPEDIWTGDYEDGHSTGLTATPQSRSNNNGSYGGTGNVTQGTTPIKNSDNNPDTESVGSDEENGVDFDRRENEAV